MLIHINAKKLRMSILFCNFVVEKVINMRARCSNKSAGQRQKKMIEPIYYNVQINWYCDHVFVKAIRDEMRSLWKQSCFMAPRIQIDDHYWGEAIDELADLLLQIVNHKNS